MESQDTPIEKIDAEALINDFKVFNSEAFQIYLTGIWKDLASRTDSKEKGIDKITFAKYYELPGIIFDRVFSVFDTDKKELLNLEVFTQGMMTLFTKSYENLVKYIFKFYDHDKDGKISREDIRIVLSYIPLNRSKITNKRNESHLKDKIESQEELHSKLNMVFKEKEELTEKEFINAIENINSDIFLYIYVFLQEKRPFNNETIKVLENIKKNPSILNMPETKGSKMIASPTLNSAFETSNTINKSPSLNKSPSVNKSPSGGENKVLKIESKMKENPNQTDILLKLAGQKIIPKPKAPAPKFKPNVTVKTKDHANTIVPMRKARHLLKDLDSEIKTKTYQGDTNILFQYARKNEIKKQEPKEELNKSISSDEGENIPSQHPIFENSEYEKGNYCGYLYKVYPNDQLKKRWFRLIYRDLYYYESIDVQMHKGMHNLSGIFIKEGEREIIRDDKHYYSFILISPSKARTYYVENLNEYKDWLFNLRKAVGYSNLGDLYDIQEQIGQGKFALVHLGINKLTKEKVAIKTISKKNMSHTDLEQVKTEIEIMKIADHPNIVRLYDEYENLDYIYIIMEYCAGGDLFSYIEKENFKLTEQCAASIIRKISSAVYFLHEYGIIHRDLKPENILLKDDTDNVDIKVLDFGLGKISGPNEKSIEGFGTLSYVSPEVLQNIPHGKPVDLWAIGIIAYFLLSGFLPFDDEHSEKEIVRQTIYDNVPFPPSVWLKISSEGKQFVENLLNKNQEKRMTIKEVLEHPWMKKYGSTNDLENQTNNYQ